MAKDTNPPVAEPVAPATAAAPVAGTESARVDADVATPLTAAGKRRRVIAGVVVGAVVVAGAAFGGGVAVGSSVGGSSAGGSAAQGHFPGGTGGPPSGTTGGASGGTNGGATGGTQGTTGQAPTSQNG